jgi:hypothetical protein
MIKNLHKNPNAIVHTLALHSKGYSLRRIAAILSELYKIPVSQTPVRRIILRDRLFKS